MWKPDLIIGPPHAPQTLRWHIFKWCGWQLALHKWLRSDDDRALHDHSADNVSLLLTGGYWDISYRDGKYRVDFRWPLIPYFRKAETPHRVRLLSNGKPVWSLWLRLPPRREWGFMCPNGWRHWRDYVNNRSSDYYADGTSEVGRGCD